MTSSSAEPRRTLTVAVVQAAAPMFDTPAALVRAEELIREAAVGHGAKVIVLPEAFLGGYPKGLDFGITVGSRTPAGRDLFRRYHAAAIEIPGPEVESLAAVTRELGCHAVVGASSARAARCTASRSSSAPTATWACTAS